MRQPAVGDAPRTPSVMSVATFLSPPAAMHNICPGVHTSALICVATRCISANVAPSSAVDAITENPIPCPTMMQVAPWHAICQPNG